MKNIIIMILIVLIFWSIIFFSIKRISLWENNIKRFTEECRSLWWYAIIYRWRIWDMQCVNQDESKVLIPTTDIYTYEEVRNIYNPVRPKVLEVK